MVGFTEWCPLVTELVNETFYYNYIDHKPAAVILDIYMYIDMYLLSNPWGTPLYSSYPSNN